MKQDGVIQELNHLLQICQAGSEGFRDAANKVENEQYQEWLNSTARLRAAFVLQPQSELRKRSAPVKAGSDLGPILHRSWMKFRHMINPHNDDVVLGECWRGEQHAIKAYESFFDKQLLPELQPMLDEQFVSMVETRDKLQEKVYRPKEAKSMLHL